MGNGVRMRNLPSLIPKGDNPNVSSSHSRNRDVPWTDGAGWYEKTILTARMWRRRISRIRSEQKGHQDAKCKSSPQHPQPKENVP